MKRPRPYWPLEEHDACALVLQAERSGRPTHENLRDSLQALGLMEHRTGQVSGESDGCGVMTDLPREFWAARLAEGGADPAAAAREEFFVGQLLIPCGGRPEAAALVREVETRLARAGADLLASRPTPVVSEVLGPLARADEAGYHQLAGVWADPIGGGEVNRRLFEFRLALERDLPVGWASLSADRVVYKARTAARDLARYFPDLADPRYRSAVTLGHSRYSTNTLAACERVQPFGVLGHNGEINTVAALRFQMDCLGIPLARDASDSQDLDRLVEALIHRYGLSLFEVMEIVFPPIHHEIDRMAEGPRGLYRYFRQAFGPFAQGPAAILSRDREGVWVGVDALGLRPLWQVETAARVVFASERGVVPLAQMTADPRPLAPGERVGLIARPGRPLEALDLEALQGHVWAHVRSRFDVTGTQAGVLRMGEARPVPPGAREVTLHDVTGIPVHALPVKANLFPAFGWDQEDLKNLEAMCQTGQDPIGSLGYDGPLAALAQERQNVADYFKEAVAVVTNPAIDRERETEHFSTRVYLGRRPALGGRAATVPWGLVLDTPILVGGHLGDAPLLDEMYRRVARRHATWVLEDFVREVVRADRRALAMVRTVFRPGERLREALDRIVREGVEAVRGGASALLVDDALAFQDGHLCLDPALVVSALDLALRDARGAGEVESLRRNCSIVVRAGSVRNLHDLIVLLGLGADAVNPWLMFDYVEDEAHWPDLPPAEAMAARREQAMENLLEALRKGLEKIISTMGIHELRGYGRVFSAIGLSPEVAARFQTVNHGGRAGVGLTFESLERDAVERDALARAEELAELRYPFRMNPHIWARAEQVALGATPYGAYAEKLERVEQEHPVALRHLLDLRPAGPPLDPSAVDVSVGAHTWPFLISSMSFGSQGETAYRCYAEAAARLNIICMNGEGGEIRDLLGRYPNTRGQQVASGRFGVSIELLNSSDYIEIKIGQGAKPGEGGHLPARKVSPKVAEARNAAVASDLISPSNNHDLYSIEDLAQLIDEIKTANPRAKVSVKVPVIPGIGTIGIGIAKAGADILTLSGYDGGTGAARKHALRYVGLPAEVGVVDVHRALTEAGLRGEVEIWADGGMRSARDVVKLLCLGANRVPFGTLAMVGLGCTICRGCQLDTCHVGIATQVVTVEEALKKGMKRFVPREFEDGVERLCRLFRALGEAVRALTAQMGVARAQDLVGRADLLVQARGRDRIDLTELLTPAVPGRLSARRSRAPVGPVNLALTARVLQGRRVAGARNGTTPTVVVESEPVTVSDRALVTHLAGEMTRRVLRPAAGAGGPVDPVAIRFNGGSLPGNGFAAFICRGLDVCVEGGAQDGVGKGALGGRIVVLKGIGADGQRVDGSVGKSFAYGAQRGLLLVQGGADSRFCIRLSGADVVVGGRIRDPRRDEAGSLSTRANLRGFAFEYMTSGRAVVLGDPGAWMCAGMTGGVVYQHLDRDMGFDLEALQRRLARGAKVRVLPLGEEDRDALRGLLGEYRRALVESGQAEEAGEVAALTEAWRERFVKIEPVRQQVDPSISTE